MTDLTQNPSPRLPTLDDLQKLPVSAALPAVGSHSPMKISKSDAKNITDFVIGVGYCQLQNMLSQSTPIASVASRQGILATVFLFADEQRGFAINTGYRGDELCQFFVNSDVCEHFEVLAKKILQQKDFEKVKADLNRLIHAFKNFCYEQYKQHRDMV